MAKNSLKDFDWHINPAVFDGVNDSLANKLASMQQSIGKLGLRKDRYADNIREALRGGRLKQREISSELNGKLNNLLERLAAKGLAKSGALNMLSGQFEAEAAKSQRQAEEATAASIIKAQNYIDELVREQALSQEEILRLLKQAASK